MPGPEPYAQRDRSARPPGLLPLAARLARVGGWAIDVDTDELEWSDDINWILDYPLGRVPELDVALSWYPEPDRTVLIEALDACRTTGTSFDLELWSNTSAGRRIRVRAVGEAQRDAEGRVVRLHGAFQDITDSYLLEEEAFALARRLESTIESMSDALFTLDRGWNFTFLNRRSEELLRRPRAELLGRNIWTEFEPAVGTEFYVAYQRARETGETQALVAYYEPLETWFDVTVYPTPEGLAVYFRDVNELVRAKRELERRQGMLDRVGDAILGRTLDDRITHWNGGAERMYGWLADEVIGRSSRELLYHDPTAFEAGAQRTLTEGAWDGEIVQRRRDGSSVTVQARWTLIRDEDGAPESVLAINSDITERKRIETELYRAQRLDSIGRLASGIAHDLNNVLTPILMATDLLSTTDPGPEWCELVDSIRTSAERGSDMVKQVLTFASGAETPSGDVDIANLVAETARIVTDTFPPTISFDVQNDSPGAIVRGDHTQLYQVLLNLCMNARDALAGGGSLAIRTRRHDIDEQYASQHPDASAGPHVTIIIEDTGTGMRPDVLDRAFEPFFTTKAHGEGTGLGLSTSLAIVKSHGGFLRLTSTHGQGTVAEVRLPLADASEPMPDVTTPAPTRGNGELVLVVDDEPAVLRITQQTLEALGYRVVTASNGADAVREFTAHPDIRVVVTDIMMPIMGGAAAMRVFRAIRPDVPVIAVSGLHIDDEHDDPARADADAFIPKPFTASQLVDTIAKVIGRADR